MAYPIRGNTTNSVSAAAATFQPTIGTHASGDLLLFCLSNDSGTTTISLGATTATLTAASDLVTYSGSDIYGDGDQIIITTSGNLTGTGLAIDTRYWVRDLDTAANTFKLAATSGGAAIDITGAGTGTHTFHIVNDASTGWGIIGTQAISQATRQVWAYKGATSASETAPTFSGTNAVWIATYVCVRAAEATPTIAWQRIDWGNSTNIFSASSNTGIGASSNSGSAISNLDNDLMLVSWNTDCGGSERKLRMLSNEVQELAKYNGSGGVAQSHVVGYRQLGAAGTVPAIAMYANVANEGGNGWVLSIKNATNGALAPDCRTGMTDLQFYGDFGTTNTAMNPTVNISPTTFVAGANIGGIAPYTAVAPTISTAASGKFSWGSYLLIRENTNIASPAWTGAGHTISSVNMSGKLLYLQWFMTGTFGSFLGAQGAIIVLRDVSNNWVAYQLRPKSSIYSQTDFYSVIAVGQAAAYDSLNVSGSMDWTQITAVAFLMHRLNGSAAIFDFNVKNLALLDAAVVTGGGAASPATFVTASIASGAWDVNPPFPLQAAAQVMGTYDLQIGDGSIPTYFKTESQNFSFPNAYSSTNQPDWNANANQAGITIKASASDTINLSASSIVATVAAPLSLDATSSASATYDTQAFLGVGFTPTWSAAVDPVSQTFSGGGIVTIAADTTWTQCTFKNTSSTVAPLSVTANNCTLDGCTTDVSSWLGATAPTYHMELGTSVTAITLTDHTFTGSALTDKIHVLKTTGTVTITISGTTDLATDGSEVTSEGATVSIVSDPVNQVVVVSGFTEGSRIQIYDTTNATELFNGTASAGNTVVSGTTATWTDPVAAAGNRAIRVRVSYVNGTSAKLWQENTGLTCGTTSGTESVTYPITQVDDDTYNNNGVDGPSIYATSGITFTDAATDLVNCNIAGGTVSWPTIYACFVHWLNTSTGIDDDVTYIDAPDTANYLLTAMKIKNTNTTPLTITGGYGRSATTGLVKDIIDTAGSTGNIFPSPDHVVAYATGSGALTPGDISDIWAAATRTLTTTIPTAAQNATELIGTAVDGTTTVAESLRLANAVLGGKVSGAGTGTETFRDLADTKDRVVATVDAAGNRTALTRDLT